MREITEEQSKTIVQLRDDGVSFQEIGQIVGFTWRSCYDNWLKVRLMRRIERERIVDKIVFPPEIQTYSCSFRELLIPAIGEIIEITFKSKV